MKLILTQQDLETAVRRYVGGLLTLSEGAKMDLEFTAGRGDKGMSVEVDINYMDVGSIPEIQNQGKTTISGAIPVQAEPATTAAPVTPEEQKKLDGRSKEARALRKGGSIFGGTGGGTATEPAEPPQEPDLDGPDAAPIDPEPDAQPVNDDRAAEAEEILAEPEVVAAPPVDTKPRKSLFS